MDSVMSHSNEMARSNSLKWDIKTHKSSDEEYDSDETCCDYNGTTAIQIAIQHLENDLENKNNKHVSNGTKSQSPLSDSTKALIQSNASDETFAQVVYLNDSLQDKFNTQTSNSERISYFGFTDMDSTVEWYEKNVENRSETTKEHDHDKEQDLFEKPESNILLTAPLDLQNCKNIPQNEVIYSENDPHCIYSGKTALECNNDNLYNVNISGTENSHTFDLFGHHEGNLPSVTTALNQMNFSEGELNLGLSHTTSLLVCCDKNDKFINLSGKELDEQINMCDVENCKDNLGITDNTLGSCTQTVCQPMSAENASFSNSNECIKGLTETLLHIFENNNNFNNFMKYNDTPLPRSSVCTPPYSLNKPTKIIKTPTQKVLPKLKQKKKNSSQKTKILPLRRCVSTYTKHLRRSNESVNITEIEESTDKTNKNLKPESEQYGVAKKQKRQRKQKTKHETNETIDEHQKSMVLPNDFKKKVNANKDIVKDLEEIEEGRATLGNRMHRWLRGLEHMTREEAFQMHSEVQCYIKKIEAIATKQRKKRGAKKTDTGVDRKKFEMYLKCLNDWSRIIDNAIADFDNIIIEQQKSSENCDDSVLVNKINVEKKELRSVLKNCENMRESTESNSKHISFSDEVEYHYLTYSTQSSGKSSHEDDYEDNFSPAHSNTDESASNSNNESYSWRFSQESERNLVKCQKNTDVQNQRETDCYLKANIKEVLVEETSQISLKSGTVKKLNNTLKVQTKINTKMTRKKPNQTKQISCDRTANKDSTNNILNISMQTTQPLSLSEGKSSINDCNTCDNINEISGKYQTQNNSPNLLNVQMTNEQKFSQNLFENCVRNQCLVVNCTKDQNIIQNHTRDQNLVKICVKDQTSIRDYPDINLVEGCIHDQSLIEKFGKTSVCIDGKLSIEPSCNESNDCIVQFVPSNSEGSIIHLNKIQKNTGNENKRVNIGNTKGEKSLEIYNERTYDDIIMQVKAVRVIQASEYIPISELPDNVWDYSHWFGDLES